MADVDAATDANSTPVIYEDLAALEQDFDNVDTEISESAPPPLSIPSSMTISAHTVQALSTTLSKAHCSRVKDSQLLAIGL